MPYWVGNKGSFGCSGYPLIQIGTNIVVGCYETFNAAEMHADRNNSKEDKNLKILTTKTPKI
jgi:hypothetical protein